LKKKIAISLGAGSALSAVALYLAFRQVPAAELWQYFSTIDYGWAVPAALLVCVSFFMRALRWQIIVGSARRIGLWQAYHPLMIGFMINCVLPGRVGELARPAILQKKQNVPFVTGLATVAAERIFDLGMLVLFFSILMAAVRIDPELSIDFGGYQLNRATLEAVFAGMVKLGLVLLAAVIALAIGRVRALVVGAIRGVPGRLFFFSESRRTRISQRLAEPLVRLVERVAEGFALIRRPRRVAACILASVGIWLTHALSYYVFALGNPAIQLSFLELSATMIIVMFFIALPSVPGFWGLWEAGGVFALALFGVPAKEAAAFTLANHFVQILPVVLLGGISAASASINLWQVSYGGKDKG
jgi:uncharacterized protein (TIRG00374 family)